MKGSDPQTIRRTILLLSGLIDCLAGAVLLLIWTGLLPVDLDGMGLSRPIAGLVGAVLFFPGLALVTYQLTRPPERE